MDEVDAQNQLRDRLQKLRFNMVDIALEDLDEVKPTLSKVKYTTSGKTLAEIVKDLSALLNAGFEVEFYIEPEAIAAPPYHPHPYGPGVRGGISPDTHIMNLTSGVDNPEKVGSGDTFIANVFVPKTDDTDIAKVVEDHIRLGSARGH